MRHVLVAMAMVAAGLVVPRGAAAGDLTIAVVGPMSGPFSEYGAQVKAGAELAVADLNATGGVAGSKLVLEVGDDACDQSLAPVVAAGLVAKGVRFVAGHFCSEATIAAAKVYAEGNVLLVTPSAGKPQLTDEGPWNVARIAARDDAQGQMAGAFLAKRFVGRKVAILDDKSAYGVALASETRKAMNAAGLTEALSDSYAAGETDFAALVDKLQAGAVDAVYLAGYGGEAGLLLKQMRQKGLTAQLVAGSALADEVYWRAAGEAGEGTLMTAAPDPTKLASAKEVVARLQAKGIDPGGYTLNAYAAVQAFAQAAAGAGDLDGHKLAEWLRAGHPLKTVLGEIALDAKGDLRSPSYVWYAWSKGTYAEVVPAP